MTIRYSFISARNIRYENKTIMYVLGNSAYIILCKMCKNMFYACYLYDII